MGKYRSGCLEHYFSSKNQNIFSISDITQYITFKTDLSRRFFTFFLKNFEKIFIGQNRQNLECRASRFHVPDLSPKRVKNWAG
jgi:hypothetical protein